MSETRPTTPAPSPLPGDRSHVLTEQRNPRSMRLHEMSAKEIVETIAEEDRRMVNAVGAAGPAISAFIEAAEPKWNAGGRLIYFGAGTSGRLGVLDASECPPTFQTEPERVVGIIAGGDSALRKSSEGMEDDPRGAIEALTALRINARDIVIGIAAGGTTPYVLGGLAWLKDRAAADQPLTALLCCSPVPASPSIDHLLCIPTGPEVVTGSTRMKAGSATKLALNTISTTLMIRSGRVYENLMVDVRASNEKLRDRAARIVSTLTGLAREQAFALLNNAGGSVKTAVVMHKLSIDRAAAEQRLQRAYGRLDAALSSGSPR